MTHSAGTHSKVPHSASECRRVPRRIAAECRRRVPQNATVPRCHKIHWRFIGSLEFVLRVCNNTEAFRREQECHNNATRVPH